MFGKFHSEETILKMSEIKKGKARSAESKLKIGLTNSKKLYIFKKKNDSLSDSRKILFKSFDNYSDAANYLNCSKRNISRYVDKNKTLKKKWFLFSKDISN